jgi:Cu(I)/Ag(I) efflux system membrane protein CusA/SilA
VIEAVRMSNNDVGGRAIEMSEREYMVRVGTSRRSTISRSSRSARIRRGRDSLRDVATIALGPEMRRGVVELNGEGEVVGGVIVMRYGENALAVIDRVKAKLADLAPSFPKGSRS